MRPLSAFALLASCLLSLPPTGAAALTSVFITAEAGITNGPTFPPTDYVELSDPVQVYGKAQIQDGLLGNGIYAASQSIGASGFGHLGSLAGAEAEAGGTSYGQGVSGWKDTFVITPSNPNLMLTPGTFTFSASVGGSGGVQLADAGVATSWDGHSNFTAYIVFEPFVVCATCSFLASGDWYASENDPVGTFYGNGTFGSTTSALLSGTVDFTFGVPVDMTATLATAAQAHGGDAGRTGAFASYLSTLLWDGMSEVRDGNGALVTAYGVTSESTTDWSQAVVVPEPSTAVLLSLGLVPLVLPGRRRRSSARKSNG